LTVIRLLVIRFFSRIDILFGTPQQLKSVSWLKCVNVADAVIPLSDICSDPRCHVRFLTLLWPLMLRLYQAPAFITLVPSGKFVHH